VDEDEREPPAAGEPGADARPAADGIGDRAPTEQALRESEERFRHLVVPFAQAIWEAAADGRVVTDSPSWRAYTGQSLDDWLGQGWSRAVHPDDREAALGTWTEAVRTGTIVDTEFRLRRADGTWRWTNVRAAPLIGADGAIRKWVGMSVDVTSHREAEAAAQAERAQRDQRQREFVDNAAHELRTPLAAMLASIDALEHGARDAPEEHERFLGHLRREAERLAQLSDSMLLLSELEAGGRAPQTQVALPPLLRSVAEQVAPAATVPVAVEVRPGLMATTNEGLLERILVNLADNAVKHTTEGRVELAAGRADSAAVIEVRDTGVGIAPEIATRVFDRFYRGGARRADGFGLGLSIARQAAEALGATLELEGREGPGTIARLTLPNDAP
jgi:PAS domain S-box-containing protein